MHFFIVWDIQVDCHQHLTRWQIHVSCTLNFVALKCWENSRTYVNSLVNWTPVFAHFDPTRWNLLWVFFRFVFLSHFKTKKIESVYLHQQTFPLFVQTLTDLSLILQALYARCRPGQVGRWNLIVTRGTLKPVYFAFVKTMLEFFWTQHILLKHEYIRQDQRRK